MSGWRIGYIVARKELIQQLMAVQDGTLCSPSVIGQHAALYALEHETLISSQINKVKDSFALTCKLLQPLIDQQIFSYSKPQAGIFLFLKTSYPDSEVLVQELLSHAKVGLTPGKDFGIHADTAAYVRLCFARTRPVIEQGIARLLDYFKVRNKIVGRGRGNLYNQGN